jgi:hypothetical protein
MGTDLVEISRVEIKKKPKKKVMFFQAVAYFYRVLMRKLI